MFVPIDTILVPRSADIDTRFTTLSEIAFLRQRRYLW